MRKDEIRKRYFSIVLCFLICLCTFLNWFEYQGTVYTIPGFFYGIIKAGGFYIFSAGDVMVFAALLSVGMSFLAALLYAVRGVLLCFWVNNTIFAYTIRWLEFISFSIFAVMNVGRPQIPTAIAFLLVAAEAIGEKYLDEREEMIRQERERKARELWEKEEERRRLYFPGRYGREFYKVIWKNYKNNWRNSALFVSSGMLSSCFLFVVFAVENMFSGIHTREDFLMGEGIQSIMVEAVILVIAINTFMMTAVFSSYIKSRMEDYQKLTVFGIRTKTMNKMMRAEYMVSLMCAFILGLVLGNLILWPLTRVFERQLNVQFTSAAGVPVYLIVLGAYVIISLVSAAANYETYIQLRAKMSLVKGVEKDKIPGKSLVVSLPAGIALLGISMYFYSQRENYESMKWIFLFLTGLFLCIRCAAAVFIKAAKRWGRKYYQLLFARQPFLYRFSKSSRNIFQLTAIHFLVMFMSISVIAANASAQPAEELYPYDFVCMSYEGDETYFDELQKEPGIELYEFPMLRVTSLKGSPFTMSDYSANSYLGMLRPQGQNVGIPESVYRKLKEMKGEPSDNGLKLKDGNIHVVYQQDRTVAGHPLDWYTNRERPNLRIGPPLAYYHWVERDSLYPERTVKSMETDILTGVFGRGFTENLVVFSDSYFESLEKEGPTNLILIKCSREQYDEAESRLQEFGERHEEELAAYSGGPSYYSSRALITDVRAERLLKEVVYGFVGILLLTGSLFILYLKYAFEIPELRKRYEFYESMGMRESTSKKTLKKEIRPFFQYPLILSAAATAVFTIFLWRLRMYDGEGIARYTVWAGGLTAAYILVQAVWYQVISGYLLRTTGIKSEKAGKEQEEEA